jgi:hypothetical protein
MVGEASSGTSVESLLGAVVVLTVADLSPPHAASEKVTMEMSARAVKRGSFFMIQIVRASGRNARSTALKA